jgi:hypothetical protein
LLAVFSFVLCREIAFLLRMANEALRIGPVVLFAPIALGFEIGNELDVAPGTDFFRHAVLVTPPAVVVVLGFGDVSVGLARRMAASDKGANDEAAQND